MIKSNKAQKHFRERVLAFSNLKRNSKITKKRGTFFCLPRLSRVFWGKSTNNELCKIFSVVFSERKQCKAHYFFFHTLLNSKLVNKIKIIFNLYFNVYSCYFIIESNNLNIKCKYIVGIRTNYHGPNIYYYYWA